MFQSDKARCPIIGSVLIQIRSVYVQNRMATNCSCCGGIFEQKGKGFKRVSLSSKFKGGPSAAETLTKNFNISFTPGKAAFICDDCTRTIRSVHVKKTQLEEVEEKFRKVRKPGSYLAMKLPATPQHRQANKKLRVMSSTLHTSTSPRKSTSTEKVIYLRPF